MLPTDLPELATVRVLTPGGPYRVGDVVSVAYVSPTIGRLVAHDTASILENVRERTSLVPETISVSVVHAATPYVAGDVLTLSFIDPRVARIHPTVEVRAVNEDAFPTSHVAAPSLPDFASDRRITSERVTGSAMALSSIDHDSVLPANRIAPIPAMLDRNTGRNETASIALPNVSASPTEIELESTSRYADDTPSNKSGVRLRLHWTADRVRRFIQVVDKLFTVDRLGWYRHAFAMRLLLPDEISCGDPVADVEATRHLVALRAATVETLGRPLLAAFMPNFSVTSDWLDSLDNPAAARAVAGLREAIAPYVLDLSTSPVCAETSVTVGIVERCALEAQPASTVESLLPLFIASDSSNGALAERLGAYRRTLIDVFGQTAASAEAVRLNGMAVPNHSLDDRLWQLVGTVGESLGGLAVA